MRRASDNPVIDLPRVLNQVIDQAGHIVIVTDVTGHICWVNEGFTALSGYSFEEAMGRKPGALLQRDDADPEAQRVMREAIKERRPFCVEVLNYSRDGRPHWMEIDSQPVHNADGEVTHFVAIVRDISEQRSRLDGIDSERAAAVAASKAKSDFLANISHELRTPLTAILGHLELLSTSALGTEQRGSVDTIQTSARHLLSVIEDILDLSKVEAGRMPIERVRCDLDGILRECVEVLSPRVADRPVQLLYEPGTGADRPVLSDPTRVRQIAVNLIGNAVKFTECGTVRVRLNYGGDLARIEVRDTGIGIPQDQQDGLFKPFVQAENIHERFHGGTGLGLALSRRLARMMGGDITFKSKPDVGSTFVAEMRCPPATPETQPEKKVSRELSLEQLSASKPLMGARILLVEDTAASRRVLRAILTACGAETFVAANGPDAIEAAVSKVPELILIDIRMPGMDGFEATRRIRAAQVRCPIVALTAHALVTDRDRMLAHDFNGYISKPCSASSLVFASLQALGRAVPRSLDRRRRAA